MADDRASTAEAQSGERPVPVEQETTIPPPLDQAPPIAPPQETPTTPSPPDVSRELGPPAMPVRELLGWLALAVPLLLFLMVEWRAWRRRKLAVQRHRSRRPPLTRPVAAVPEPSPFAPGALKEPARQLQRRETGEARVLAVEETISATIDARGYPTLRFRSLTRAPEYLVLIERSSHRDHQARLFNELAWALRQEDLPVVRFYFENDPRIVTDEYSQRWRLSDLQSRYHTSRLLVFAQGNGFLHPVTGAPHPWVTRMHTWEKRAVLTAEPPATWGAREISLARHFVVLPATGDGLSALVDSFEPDAETDLAYWKRFDIASPQPSLLVQEAVEDLRRHLGSEAFTWLCACALYPELHWDLTLRIGRHPAIGTGVLSEENLLKLVRLPWFRRGAIPDDVRVALMRQLDEETEIAVRSEIIEILERNLAPDISLAGAQQRLDVAVQKMFAHRKHRAKRRAARRELQQFPIEAITRDRAVMRLLEEGRRSPVAFFLPAVLRARVYRGGVPLLGMHTTARAGTAAAAAIAGLVIVRPPVMPTDPADPPTGLIAEDAPESTCATFGDAYNLRGECFDTPPRPLQPTMVAVPDSVVMPSPAVVAIQVNETGSPSDVFLTDPSDDSSYNARAIARARAITYAPATLDGDPVSAWIEEAFFPEPQLAASVVDGGGTAAGVDREGRTFPARRIVLSTSLLQMSAADRWPVRALVGTGSELPADSVQWRSLQPTIATVDSAGFLVAHRAGEATLEATAAGSVTARLLVRVRAVPVAPAVASVALAVGKTRATPMTDRGVVLRGPRRDVLARQMTWRSQAPSIAQVSAAGEITGVSLGKTVVTVGTGGGARRIAVTVHARPAMAYGDPNPLTTVTIPVAGKKIFVGGLATANREAIPEAEIHWRMLDTTIARFDPTTRTVIGLRPGRTRLQFADNEEILGAFWDLEVVAARPEFVSNILRLELGDTLLAPVAGAATGTALDTGPEFELRSLEAATLAVGPGGKSFIAKGYGTALGLLLHDGQVLDTLQIYVRPHGPYLFEGELRYGAANLAPGVVGSQPNPALTGAVNFEDLDNGIRISLDPGGPDSGARCEEHVGFEVLSLQRTRIRLDCTGSRPGSGRFTYTLVIDQRQMLLQVRGQVRVDQRRIVSICVRRDRWGICVEEQSGIRDVSSIQPVSANLQLRRLLP